MPEGITAQQLSKPKLRGVLHSYGAVGSLAAGLVLLQLVRTTAISTSLIVYISSLVLLFSSSSVYHWPTWPPKTRSWLRRLDHASIYCLIAGTYTPLSVILLPDPERQKLLMFIWGCAATGTLHQLFWPGGPKWLSACIYIVMTLAAWFYGSDLTTNMPPYDRNLLVLGGVFYVAGAAFYAAHWPNLKPGVFGYHELFHALVMAASICHFSCITRIVRSDYVVHNCIGISV